MSRSIGAFAFRDYALAIGAITFGTFGECFVGLALSQLRFMPIVVLLRKNKRRENCPRGKPLRELLSFPSDISPLSLLRGIIVGTVKPPIIDSITQVS